MDDANDVSQGPKCNLANILPVDSYSTFVNVIIPAKELSDCCLSCARWSHDADHFSRTCLKCNVTKCPLVLYTGGVAEVDIFEADDTVVCFKRFSIWRIGDGGPQVKDIK